MYRILPCTQDTYITNKIVSGQRCTDSNIGQAGTLDLYKLYDETYLSGSTTPIELSRLLFKFDLAPLQALTSSVLDINSNTFRCHMSLKDIYGGQTVPSNFVVVAYPLAKSFDEGRGSDVIAYRDIDVANWLTSSAGVPWTVLDLWDLAI